MKRFISEERDLLTDGEMDFSIPPPHGFTCTINTTVENPALRDYSHSFSPPGRELVNKEMEKMKQMNIIEPSFSPWSNKHRVGENP